MRLSSEYLWSCETVSDAIVETLLLLYDLFGESLWFQVSEVDLCTDVVGWDASRSNEQELFEQRQMGHTTLTMTNHYALLTIEQLKRSHEAHSPLRVKQEGVSRQGLGTGYWEEE